MVELLSAEVKAQSADNVIKMLLNMFRTNSVGDQITASPTTNNMSFISRNTITVQYDTHHKLELESEQLDLKLWRSVADR